MPDMSISLKVVKLALVFCDSLRRLEIVWRILFIGTRVSSLAPLISDGAFLLITLDKFADELGVGVGAETAWGAEVDAGAAWVGADTFGAGVGVGASFFASAFGAAAGAALGVPLGSISTNLAPTGTVSPSAAWYLTMTPVWAERISTVTLSVSILAIMSSALTESPTSNECYKSWTRLTLDKRFNNTFTDGVAHSWNLLCGYSYL